EILYILNSKLYPTKNQTLFKDFNKMSSFQQTNLVTSYGIMIKNYIDSKKYDK
ncbi:unnamed protein product, partial [marine sediment metagenome]